MKPKFGIHEKKLKEIKKNDLLRILQDSIVEKQFIKINKKKLLNFSSNDYLGIKPEKIKYSQFQSSSRLVSGNDESFSILEKKLSKHKSQEKTIIYPTGYMANLGVISALASKQDTIFSDEYLIAQAGHGFPFSWRRGSDNLIPLLKGAWSNWGGGPIYPLQY